MQALERKQQWEMDNFRHCVKRMEDRAEKERGVERTRTGEARPAHRKRLTPTKRYNMPNASRVCFKVLNPSGTL